jgi:hypothetical protein
MSGLDLRTLRSAISIGTVVFLDTSIQIARALRERAMRTRIDAWSKRYRLRVTGKTAIQEFRDRVLRDTYYLLTKLNQLRSYEKTRDFVFSVLPRQMMRKQRICMLVLHKIRLSDSDAELTERARLYCRTLLVHGESRAIQGVDSIGPGLGCHSAGIPIREKRPYERYEFPKAGCSNSSGRCALPMALQSRADLCGRLLAFLDGLAEGRLTSELQRARAFLRLVAAGETTERLLSEDACVRVGDLLLAFESERTGDVYTMNYAESQAFCDFLGQELVVRPNHPDSDEIVYGVDAKPWPLP